MNTLEKTLLAIFKNCRLEPYTIKSEKHLIVKVYKDTDFGRCFATCVVDETFLENGFYINECIGYIQKSFELAVEEKTKVC